MTICCQDANRTYRIDAEPGRPTLKCLFLAANKNSSLFYRLLSRNSISHLPRHESFGFSPELSAVETV